MKYHYLPSFCIALSLHIIVSVWILSIPIYGRPIISTITPYFGGAEGGTELTITGEGFQPDALTSSYVVYIGGEICKANEYYSTNERIVCTTPKCFTQDCLSDQQWEGSEDVSLNVYVGDVIGITEAGGQYRFHGGYTPEITKMNHYTWGSATSWIYGSMETPYLADITVRIGGNLMFLGEEDELNPDTLDQWSRDVRLKYVTPTDMASGFFNLTMDVQTDLSGGNQGSGLARTFTRQRPFKYSSDMTYLPNYATTLSGRTYSVCVLPAVTSISPQQGSVAGGTEVTITGSGFPSDSSLLTIYVGGRRCDVLSSAFSGDRIRCVTRAAESREQLSAALLSQQQGSDANQFSFTDEHAVLDSTRCVGSAGWWMKLWDYSQWSSSWDATEQYPEAEVRFSGGMRHGLSHGMFYLAGSNWDDQVGYGGGQQYVADFATTLRAPFSGVYYFSGIADDLLYLFGRSDGDKDGGDGLPDDEEVLLFSASYPPEYYPLGGLARPLSAGVNLTRGELYHLRARGVNTGGPDFFEVSVRIDPLRDPQSGHLLDYRRLAQDGTADRSEAEADLLFPAVGEDGEPLPLSPELLHQHSVKEVQAIQLDLEYYYEVQSVMITGAEGGYFQLAVLNAYITGPLYLSSSEATIKSELERASRQAPSSLQEARYYKVSKYLGENGQSVQLNITFEVDNISPLTELFVLIGNLEGDFPDAVVTRIQEHSLRPVGKFGLDLTINDQALHTELDYGISARNMALALQELSTDITVEVSRFGHIYEGYTWLVTFITPRGDIAPMAVNTSSIERVASAGWVTTMEEGSEESLFFRPIPTWMTEVPLDWATDGDLSSSLELYVTLNSGDKLKAVCDGSESSYSLLPGMFKGDERTCSFDYAVEATAIVGNFSMQGIDASTTRVYISGSRFLSISSSVVASNVTTIGRVSVAIAGQACNITVLEDEFISCDVESVPWGSYAPVVHIDGYGDALLATNATLRFKQTIYSIYPDEGSFAGGQIVTITGRGFRLDATVTVGGSSATATDGGSSTSSNVCELISATTTELVCRTPPAPQVLTSIPTQMPTTEPSLVPTAVPTGPSQSPTRSPTIEPTAEPTAEPTGEPTTEPTAEPTAEPTSTHAISSLGHRHSVNEEIVVGSSSQRGNIRDAMGPASEDTRVWRLSESATTSFFRFNTNDVSTSAVPTREPTAEPSTEPTAEPTAEPTTEPTADSSVSTSQVPSDSPTAAPSYIPSDSPTHSPTGIPSDSPTATPTLVPTSLPSALPSDSPTATPTLVPTLLPSALPTALPTAPTVVPTTAPTQAPTAQPTVAPSAPTSTPTFKPTTLDTYVVYVDDMDASTRPSGVVTYSYSDSLTPLVSSVLPSAVSSAITHNLTIVGDGFRQLDTTVTVDAQLCEHLTFKSDFELSCVLARDPDFGALREVDVKVHVPGKGYAGKSSDVLSLPSVMRGFEISDIRPLSGSVIGGNVLTLSGFGFHANRPESHIVLLQIVDITPLSSYDVLLEFLGFDIFTERQAYEEFECIAFAATLTELQCEIASHHGDVFPDYTYDVTVTLNSVTAVCQSSGNCTYVQTLESTPTVGSSVDILVDTSKGEYTFGVEGTLLNQGALTAWVNDMECTVLNVTNSSAVITTPPMTAGLWDVVVNVEGFGHAWSLAQLHVTSAIHSVTFDSSNGSVAGGTSLVIDGKGFSPICHENLVTVVAAFPEEGEEWHVPVTELHACTTTELKVLTPSLLSLLPDDIHRGRDPDLRLSVVEVSTALHESSYGDASFAGQAAVGFDYALASTPLVILNDTDGFEGTALGVLAFSDMPDMSESVSVTVGGQPCLLLRDEDEARYEAVGTNPNKHFLARYCSVPPLGADGTPYDVLVRVPPLGYAVTNTSSALLLPAFTSLLEVHTFQPYSIPASVIGGTVITIEGRGFSSNLTVSLCDALCTFETGSVQHGDMDMSDHDGQQGDHASPATGESDVSYGSLVCTLPPRLTTAAIDDIHDSGFNLDLVEPLSGTFFSSLASPAAEALANAHDGDYDTYFSHGSPSCYLGVEVQSGYQARPIRLRFYPRLQYSVNFGDYVFEASTDGASFQVVGAGSGAAEGWNFVDVNATFASSWFTYFRYRSLDADVASSCAIAEVEVLGVVGAVDATCPLVVHSGLTNSWHTIADVVYTPADTFTPKVYAITPNNGTALGGTIVQVIGEHFTPHMSMGHRLLSETMHDHHSAPTVTVEFSGVPCEVHFSNDTLIECTTGRRLPEDIQTSSILVNIAGRGDALVGDDVRFLFIDRWSALTTWRDQEPPAKGDVVWVPDGQVVLLDQDTPVLTFLLVEGDLYFDRTKDINLDSYYILVYGGYFEVGTAEEPFEKQAVITLHGDRYTTIEIPHIGAKVLAAMDKGTTHSTHTSGAHIPAGNKGHIEIHGQKRLRTWTKINQTAYAGDSWLITSEPVDFKDGEEVVLTSRGRGIDGASTMIVAYTSDDGHNVTFRTPLQRTHESQIITVEGRSIDTRLSIGLLTRNVKVQGDEEKSNGQLFGVHTVTVHGGIYRMENVEFTRCGQAFVFGRYCTHSHMSRDMEGSYVKANSIHHSFQRAVTTHGTDNWEVRDNVAYDVKGHAYFMEDGDERNNYVTGNLGVLLRASSALLKGDQAPAIFWTSTPTNFWRDNVAAHSTSRGFWFEHVGQIRGVCSIHEHIGEFVNMTLHSNGGIGLRIYPEWTPLDPPCGGSPAPQYLYGLVSFNNGGNALFSKRHGSIHHRGHALLDSGTHDVSIVKLQSVDYTTIPTFQDCMFIGTTRASFSIDDSLGGKHGVLMPQNEYFFIKDCKFVNYGSNPGAIAGCNSCLSDKDLNQGAKTYRFEGIEFFNTHKRIAYYRGGTQKDIFWDLDGSIAGVPDSMITKNMNFLRWSEDCEVLEPASMFGDSIRCGGNGSTARIRRLALEGVTPSQLSFTDIIVRSATGEQELYFLPKTEYGWVFPVVTGGNRSYTVEWRDAGVSGRTFDYTFGVPAYLEETKGDPRYLETVRLDYQPHYWDYIAYTFGVTYGDVRKQASKNNTDFLDRMAEAEYDNKTIRAVVSNVGSYSSSQGEYNLVLDAQLCPPQGCPVPPVPTIGDPLLWSQKSSWANLGYELPQEGQDLTIESNMWIVMDISPPKLGILTIAGKLSFLSNETDPRSLTLKCHSIAQYGIFEIAGNDNGSFVGDATVVLYGRKGASLPVTMAEGVFLGAKVLAVAGPLIAKGRSKGESWVRLNHTVPAGSTNLTLASSLSWNVGDDVVFSPTAYFDSEGDTWGASEKGSNADEVATIAAVVHHYDSITNASFTYITLDRALNHTHLCEEHHGELFCGAVGVLTRSVRFISEDSESPDTSSYAFGGHMHVFKIPGSTPRFGSVYLENVELKNFGKKNSDQYALRFQYDQLDHPPSTVKSCAFNAGYNLAMRAESTYQLQFEQNIALGNWGGGLYIDGACQQYTVKNNLAIGTRQLPSVLLSSFPWVRNVAGFTIQSSSGLVSGNLAAGSEDQGFMVATAMFHLPREHKQTCAVTYTDDYSYDSDVIAQNAAFFDNEAVGCRGGLFVMRAFLGESSHDDCAVITGFTGWRNSHTGIMAIDMIANVLVAHTVVAENHVGVYLHYHKRGVDEMFSGVVASKVIGTLSDSTDGSGDCTDLPDSKYTKGQQCNAFTKNDPLGLLNECNSVIKNVYRRVGILLPHFANKGRTCTVSETFDECEPPSTPDRLCSMPWESRYALPISYGYTEQHIHDTSFLGFHDRYEITDDLDNDPICILGSNELPSAAVAINPALIDQQPLVISSGLQWDRVDIGARFGFDLGEWEGQCNGLCSGHHMVMLHDKDGTANDEGLAGQLVYDNPNFISPFPQCYETPDMQLGLYFCPEPGVNRPTQFRQFTGLWRDSGPQVIGPIVTDRVLGNHNRTFPSYAPKDEMCAVRMSYSRYQLMFAAGHVHKVRSTGTIPSEFVIRWDAPFESDATVVEFFVQHSEVINVFVSDRLNGGFVQVDNSEAYPTLTDAAGTNQRNPQKRYLAVTLRGGRYRYYKFVKVPVVAVTIKMEMEMADFFSDTFIANMALLLSIDTSRIAIVDVRAGSVIVDTNIGPSNSVANTSGEIAGQVDELQQIYNNLTAKILDGEIFTAFNVTVSQVFATEPIVEIPFDELDEPEGADQEGFNVTAYKAGLAAANEAKPTALLSFPTSMPTGQPSGQPSLRPTPQPFFAPTGQPTSRPTTEQTQPSGQPTSTPTSAPSAQPSVSHAPTSQLIMRIRFSCTQHVENLDAVDFAGNSEAQLAFISVVQNSLSSTSTSVEVEIMHSVDVLSTLRARRLLTAGIEYRVTMMASMFFTAADAPDYAALAQAEYDAFQTALTNALSNGQFSTDLQASGVDALSTALSDETDFSMGILTFSVVDTSPTKSPSSSSSSSSSGSSDIGLEPYALAVIAIAGALLITIAAAALYYFFSTRTSNVDSNDKLAAARDSEIMKKSNKRAPSDSAKRTRVVPVIRTKSQEFLDLENFYPISPEFTGSPAPGATLFFRGDDEADGDGSGNGALSENDLAKLRMLQLERGSNQSGGRLPMNVDMGQWQYFKKLHEIDPRSNTLRSSLPASGTNDTSAFPSITTAILAEKRSNRWWGNKSQQQPPSQLKSSATMAGAAMEARLDNSTEQPWAPRAGVPSGRISEAVELDDLHDSDGSSEVFSDGGSSRCDQQEREGETVTAGNVYRNEIQNTGSDTTAPPQSRAVVAATGNETEEWGDNGIETICLR